jgi:hypothetical protein
LLRYHILRRLHLPTIRPFAACVKPCAVLINSVQPSSGQEASNSSARRWSAWPRLGRWRIGLVKPCPSVRRRLRCRQGAIPEALRQASVRRSSGLSTSVPLPRGHASSRNHALVDGTFRVSVREPEREIVRWGPGRAWRAFLANGSIAATGRAAPGRCPPHNLVSYGISDSPNDQRGMASTILHGGNQRRVLALSNMHMRAWTNGPLSRPKPEQFYQCGARTRSGKPCRSPATKKGRCRLHGGASGSGGPPGERNGQYRHGERTKTAIAERQKFSALLKMLRAGLT